MADSEVDAGRDRAGRTDPDSRARTHLANERTFLAWLRTGLALIVLGIGAAQFVSQERQLVPGLPVGTLVVNVLGCMAMGLLASGLALRGGQHLAPFLLTGVLGGFTTFSAFALDTTVLWQRGDSGLAMGYVLASVVLSLAAVSAGLAIGRGIFA